MMKKSQATDLRSAITSLKTIAKTKSRREHVDIERARRQKQNDLLGEMKLLNDHWRSPCSRSLSQSRLIDGTLQQIIEINRKYQHDFVGPSYLNHDEKQFLQIETCNGFLFVISLQSPSCYPIVHVNQAIKRVLDSTPEQWLHQDFVTLIHPDDFQYVQTQLMSLTSSFPTPIKLKCRIQRQIGIYSTVLIDGFVKYLDSSLQPILDHNQLAYPMFVAVCQLPLSIKYKEMNQHFYQNSSSWVFHCRCSTPNWLIFLVDRTISTMPHRSFEVFLGKSILDFIHPDERMRVSGILDDLNLLMLSEVINCSFIDPINPIPVWMSLSIKPCINIQTQKTDFLELHFESQSLF